MPGAVGFSDYGSVKDPAAVGQALQRPTMPATVPSAVPDQSLDYLGRTALPGFGADATTRRPETTTSDELYDPISEHSPSATASMVGLLMQRTSGGGNGAGKIQNPSPAKPGQRDQFKQMGLSDAEIGMLEKMGAAKPDATLVASVADPDAAAEAAEQPAGYGQFASNPGAPISTGQPAAQGGSSVMLPKASPADNTRSRLFGGQR